MPIPSSPLAVFDSGMGGLTVLERLQKKFPQESFVYLGDTARLPYGTKSADTVRHYAVQMADRLMAYRPKAMVIACNTASAMGLDAVRDHVGDIPVIGMIDPAARAAVRSTRNGCIAVLGTHGTVRSRAYHTAIERLNPDLKVQAFACPLLVPLAEEGWVDHPATRDILETYLAPLLMDRARPDTVILGCTHFPVFFASADTNVTRGTFYPLWRHRGRGPGPIQPVVGPRPLHSGEGGRVPDRPGPGI